VQSGRFAQLTLVDRPMSGEMEKIRKKLDEFEEKMTHTRHFWWTEIFHISFLNRGYHYKGRLYLVSLMRAPSSVSSKLLLAIPALAQQNNVLCIQQSGSEPLAFHQSLNC
jgi:hypothetical protein